MGISQREEVFDALRTARDVVVGVDGLGAPAHGDVEPVVVRIADRIDARRRAGVLLDLRTGNHRAVALGVFQRHVEQFGCLRRADVVGDHRREVQTVGERDVHLGLARGARAGGYDDDAVGALGAEHGRRRSVFEHRQRGDFVGVDVREAALHAVNEHQRRGTVPARYAADEDVGVVVAGLSARLDGRHARKFAGDGVGDVRGARIDELFVVHLRDGAQDALFLLNAVSDHHHVFDLMRLFGQPYRQRRGVGDGDLPRLEAQERDVEHVAFADAERECALRVGDRTAGRSSLDRDRRAGDRNAVGIDDAAFGLDRRLLLAAILLPGGGRFCRDGEQQQQHRGGQAAKPVQRCRKRFEIEVFHIGIGLFR